MEVSVVTVMVMVGGLWGLCGQYGFLVVVIMVLLQLEDDDGG